MDDGFVIDRILQQLYVLSISTLGFHAYFKFKP